MQETGPPLHQLDKNKEMVGGWEANKGSKHRYGGIVILPREQLIYKPFRLTPTYPVGSKSLFQRAYELWHLNYTCSLPSADVTWIIMIVALNDIIASLNLDLTFDNPCANWSLKA